ncbi:calcium-activated chloride channel regulator 1-like [Apostichopus japonicus]|uniref:calcium-activated chloride channel regulator 1-like n=1 Tax=Stichopus japonicus TaxID=307972 RepID=UPI003AB7E9CA
MALLSLSLCLVSVILSLVTSPVTGLNKPSGVKLENNEYTGIVVAIHEDEPENLELIDAIKEMFINGSAYLYNATKKRAFFKEVTILIPKTWSDSPTYTAPGNATFEGADIIVAAYNPRFSPDGANGAIPYTKQFAGCGEQSLYIHMTSSFLSYADNLYSVVGDYGRVLVHEWGHYRWGLFNEYPDHKTDQNRAKDFYYSETNQIWEPVSCSSDWRFTPLKFTGRSPKPYRRCLGDQRIGYENGCVSVPSKVQPPHVSGSVMHSYLNFDQIVNFCDNTPDDPGYLHNSEAPTKQNERCDGRSCWEVMRDHPDFNGNTNNPPREVHDVTPTFFVVRSKITRVVLVLDTSGSMSTSDRYLKLADAARTYIMTVAAPGTFIGIVDFDSDATIISYLTEMTSDTERRTLANLVPEDAKGGTCIGCGMEEALNILTAEGDPGGSKILLMTDGEDGEPDHTSYMKVAYISNKVIIDAVAISNAAEPNLVDLASSTGGRFYLQTDNRNSTGVRDALSANSGGASDFETRIELQSVVVAFEVDDESFRRSVYIDATIGRLTIFDFTNYHPNPSSGAAVHITVTSPSGETFDRSSTYYEDDLAFKKVVIRIPDIAEPGAWEYYIQNQDTTVAHDVIVSVSSFPSQEGVDPIIVTSFLSGSPSGIVNNKPLVAYAEVRQRFYPVVGATVIATVETPSGVPVELQLYDNGAGADVTKNDGIYSRYFTQLSGVGFYGFKIRVENNGEATVLRPRTSSRFSATGIYVDPELLLSGNITESLGNISIALPGTPIPEIVGVSAPNFTRGVSGGASSVSETPPGWDPSIDTFAPNKITDLAVLNTSFSLGTVTIIFTAPGDNFDFGNAHHYVISWANSAKELRNKSSTTNEIYQTDVLHGNLSSPAPYGDEEIMIIQVATIPQHLETYSVVLGLYAVDESGNEGDMSNTAKMTFRQEIPTPEPVQTTVRLKTTTSVDKVPYTTTNVALTIATKTQKVATTPYENAKTDNMFNNMAAIALSLVSISMLVLGLILLGCYGHSRNKARRDRSLKVVPKDVNVDVVISKV